MTRETQDLIAGFWIALCCRFLGQGELDDINAGTAKAIEAQRREWKRLGEATPGSLTFAQLAKANRERLVAWHGELVDWTVADWAVAMAGEAGEVCNAVKKLRRIETGTVGAGGPWTKEEAVAAIADEVADTLIYLDLLAWKLGFDLSAAVTEKFNRISVREGFPHRLGSGG